jgi:hypothetical protein
MIGRKNDRGKLAPPPSTDHYGYAVVGPDFRLCEASPSFQRLVGECQIGILLDEILPAFAGVEATLTEIVKMELPYWYLQNIAHSRSGEAHPRFLNILVLPDRSGDGLFVTVRDVTAEAAITHRAIQERNEAQLRARR